MTKTYKTSAGERMITETPNFKCFSIMSSKDTAHTMLIDNRAVEQQVQQGKWKLKEDDQKAHL